MNNLGKRKCEFRLADKAYPILTCIALIVIWQALVQALQIPSYILPTPLQILTAIASDHTLILSHAVITAKECLFGFLISLSTALGFSLLMDNFPSLKKSLYPLLVISQTIPTMALAPILLIWFGIGMTSKVIIIVLMCFFPICISLIDGFDHVDKDYLRFFQASNATKLQEYLHLKLPSAMPGFFSGLKISVTYMVMAAVIGEWLGGSEGIGVYMLRAKNTFALDRVFGAILLVVFSSMVLIYIVEALSRRLVHWT